MEDKTVISPLMGEGRAREEIARRALVTEPSNGMSRKDRVVAELDKLSAYEVCCVLGAMRVRLGRDLPLTQIYELAVRSIVTTLEDMTDGPS